MTMNPQLDLTITRKKSSGVLSPEQTVFNKLLCSIDKEKQKLLAWNDVVPKHKSEYLLVFTPLLEEMRSLKSKLITTIDRWYRTENLNKTEKSKIKFLVTDLLGDVMHESNFEDLKEIYNRHTSRDLDKDRENEKKDFMEMVFSQYGIELEDDFDSSPEATEKAAAKLREKMRLDQELREKQRSSRKKSARTIEKEKRLADKELQVSQSIKEIHRKLVLQLHPDKESDPEERDRKTLLMQQINTAYKNSDLLKLLELQIETEIADSTYLNEVTAERLGVYNKILTTQLHSLRNELRFVQTQFQMEFNMDPFVKLHSSTLMARLHEDIESANAKILKMKQDLLDFEDVKKLKQWLRSFRPARKITMDDLIFDLGR